MKKAQLFFIGLGLALALFIRPATAAPASPPAATTSTTVAPTPSPPASISPKPDAATPAAAIPTDYVIRGTGKQVGRVSSAQELLVTITDDQVRVRAVINYNFTNSPTAELSLSVPEGFLVTDVRGAGITLSKVSGGALIVKFARSNSGAYQLQVDLEQSRETPESAVKLPELTTAGIAQESGFVAVEVAPGLEAKRNDTNRLTDLDPAELPPTLRAAAQQPLLYAYKFNHHPYAAGFALTRYSQVTTLNATIDTANLVTVLTPEGRMLTRVIYEVRNNRKQYLKLNLPGKAEIWSVFVNEKPVLATTDGKGQFFIPLLLAGGGPTDGSFKVELIYYFTISKLEKRGDLKTLFPQADLPISEMLASLYLPPKYAYKNFEGSMERIELDEELQAANQPPAGGSEQNVSVSSIHKNSAFALNRQMAMEQEIADETRKDKMQYTAVATAAPTPGGTVEVVNGATPALTAAGTPGVLPVKFSVPLRGQLFRFTKLVVVNETPELTFNYKKTWTKAAGRNPWRAGKVVLWALLVALLVSVIRWIWRRPRPQPQPFSFPRTPAAPEPAPALDGLTPAAPPIG